LGIGFFGAAIGLFLTSLISVHSSYVGGVLPEMGLMGVFIGVIMPAMVNAALHEFIGQEAGLGSAGQNIMRQIGGALGLVCLTTLAFR
jgi:hypothetical protein